VRTQSALETADIEGDTVLLGLSVVEKGRHWQAAAGGAAAGEADGRG
jgi:hypothetical protein